MERWAVERTRVMCLDGLPVPVLSGTGLAGSTWMLFFTVRQLSWSSA